MTDERRQQIRNYIIAVKHGWNLNGEVNDFLDFVRELGYRIPPKLELIGDEEILKLLYKLREYNCSFAEFAKYATVSKTDKAITQAQLAADRKAIEGVKDERIHGIG